LVLVPDTLSLFFLLLSRFFPRFFKSTIADGIAQDNEIGPSTNPSFGKVTSRTLDPHYKRDYNLQYSAGIQHQVRRGAVDGGTRQGALKRERAGTDDHTRARPFPARLRRSPRGTGAAARTRPTEHVGPARTP